MSVLELLGGLDWWQLGWLLAGLFMVLFFGLLAAHWGQRERFRKIGSDEGWHERQHWEGDELLKGALQHAFDKK